MSGKTWLIAGLALAAGIGTGVTLMYVIARVTARTLALLDAADEDPDADDPGDDAGDRAGDAAGAALAQVTDYARQHAAFGRDWDSAVRQAADAMTAAIAGRRMAGQAYGEVGLYASYPALPALGSGVLEAAFQLAVHDEVTRRIAAMNGPGAFG